VSYDSAFSPDYTAARARFRASALSLGARLQEFPIGQKGPDGEDLTLDVALLGAHQPRKAVVVSSGTHGVEGFMGSAVQAALMEELLPGWRPPQDAALVLIHAVNPFGFAWIRRTNEDNVDQNRNFLLAGQAYEGSPEGYADADPILNPQSPPARFELFTLRAIGMILQKGMPTLKNAVAGGQYDYPKGLMYGGNRPSRSHLILKDNLPRWVGSCTDVLHIDFHTGLGRSATYKLLADHGWGTERLAWLGEQFGEDYVEPWEPERGVSYSIRGGIGPWCQHQLPEVRYDLLAAEFGTVSILKVIGALRAENQAHHWGDAKSPLGKAAKDRLKQTFCPVDPKWRHCVVERGLTVVQQAMNALFEPQSPASA